MFGASHSGRSSTNAFHYTSIALVVSNLCLQLDTHIMAEDVVRNIRLVDTGVFVCFEVGQRFLGDALVDRCFCVRRKAISFRSTR